MTVKELIELLIAEDQDAEVYVSSDEEGNTIKPVQEPIGAHPAMNCVYQTGEIDIVDPDDVAAGEWDDDDIFNVIVIYP